MVVSAQIRWEDHNEGSEGWWAYEAGLNWWFPGHFGYLKNDLGDRCDE